MRSLTGKVIWSFIKFNFGFWVLTAVVISFIFSLTLNPSMWVGWEPIVSYRIRILLVTFAVVLVMLAVMFGIKSYKAELRYLGRKDKSYCHEHGILCPDAESSILKNFHEFLAREDLVMCPECKKLLPDMYRRIDELITKPSK